MCAKYIDALILSPCARSLSLKELHAKSREHGSYESCIQACGSRFGTWLEIGRPPSGRFGRVGRVQFHWVKLSKNGIYLLDNALLNIIAFEAWGQGEKQAGRGWCWIASFAPTLSQRTLQPCHQSLDSIHAPHRRLNNPTPELSEHRDRERTRKG